jgi:hypothetical protein
LAHVLRKIFALAAEFDEFQVYGACYSNREVMIRVVIRNFE